MGEQRRRWPRRLALAVVLILVVGLGGFFAFAPPIVESSMNKVADVEIDEPSREARVLHETLFIADMHSDTLMWRRDPLKRADRGHMDLPRLQEGNVGLQVFSSVSKTPKGQNYDSNSADTDNITLLSFAQLQPPRTWFSVFERSMYHAEKLHNAAERSRGGLRVITTEGELEQLIADRQDGKKVVGALFSLEGLQNLEGDFANLQKLYDAGARMAGFTHFFDNEVAGSMHGEEKGGLTDLGREVLREMERLGMVVDVAHASHAAIAEMLAMATKPVVASHGGVQATCDVNRNLNDDEIRGIAATGGVVGIGYWDAAVCELSPAAVVDAIEHVIEVGGIETAALGSDFDGATTVGWDTSQLVVITQELMNRGYRDDEIAAIMGGNTLRVLLEVLPE
ncbi:dipeptidase [Tessaracoccus caeni]|uniref:dipeptidase n=1 Tax=Tessaracoccus caeni TaxID=3031239 RepID=UPI0023DA9A8B|nr:dipeptidase [Tessaracoccus caeni]MDF1489732.1 dipeptidase [Tessaracoccus caeni]